VKKEILRVSYCGGGGRGWMSPRAITLYGRSKPSGLQSRRLCKHESRCKKAKCTKCTKMDKKWFKTRKL